MKLPTHPPDQADDSVILITEPDGRGYKRILARIPVAPACEFDDDSAFEAWYQAHGAFIASWDKDPIAIAEAAWTAALDWKRKCGLCEQLQEGKP